MPRPRDVQLTRRRLLYLAGLSLPQVPVWKLQSPHRVQPILPEQYHSPSIREQMRQSTVIVSKPRRTDIDEITIRDSSWGTGFHVGNGIFVTNRHVVSKGIGRTFPMDDIHMCRLFIGHPDYKTVSPQHINRFNYADVATLETGNQDFTSLSPTSRIPRMGEVVCMSTYQNTTRSRGGGDSIHFIHGRVVGHTYDYSNVRVPELRYIIATGIDEANDEPNISPGASGSPVVDSRGNVCAAITSFQRGFDSTFKVTLRLLGNVDPDTVRTLAYAVPLHQPAIRDHLESHGILYR